MRDPRRCGIRLRLATLAVHAIKARLKQRDRWLEGAAFAGSAIGVLAALGIALLAPSLRLLGIALALPLAAVLVVSAAGVHPRALKRVGWTLVAANTGTLLLFTRL